MYYWVKCQKDSQILKNSPKENVDAHIIGKTKLTQKVRKNCNTLYF